MNKKPWSTPVVTSLPPKQSFLHIEVLAQDKAKWVRAAQDQKTTLAQWVISRLNGKS